MKIWPRSVWSGLNSNERPKGQEVEVFNRRTGLAGFGIGLLTSLATVLNPSPHERDRAHREYVRGLKRAAKLARSANNSAIARTGGGAGEKARRRAQIEKGQLTFGNGLVLTGRQTIPSNGIALRRGDFRREVRS